MTFLLCFFEVLAVVTHISWVLPTGLELLHHFHQLASSTLLFSGKVEPLTETQINLPHLLSTFTPLAPSVWSVKLPTNHFIRFKSSVKACTLLLFCGPDDDMQPSLMKSKCWYVTHSFLILYAYKAPTALAYRISTYFPLPQCICSVDMTSSCDATSEYIFKPAVTS